MNVLDQQIMDHRAVATAVQSLCEEVRRTADAEAPFWVIEAALDVMESLGYADDADRIRETLLEVW